MHNATVQLTLEGKLALEDELHELEAVRRPSTMAQVIEAQAGSDGDDDATPGAAASDLAYIDRRIHEIASVLRRAVIISGRRSGRGRAAVHLGSQGVVRDPTGDEQTWCIVDSAEANARVGKISNLSPVGAALLGKKQGETVAVHVPGGDTDYTIMRVG